MRNVLLLFVLFLFRKSTESSNQLWITNVDIWRALVHFNENYRKKNVNAGDSNTKPLKQILFCQKKWCPDWTHGSPKPTGSLAPLRRIKIKWQRRTNFFSWRHQLCVFMVLVRYRRNFVAVYFRTDILQHCFSLFPVNPIEAKQKRDPSFAIVFFFFCSTNVVCQSDLFCMGKHFSIKICERNSVNKSWPLT